VVVEIIDEDEDTSSASVSIWFVFTGAKGFKGFCFSKAGVVSLDIPHFAATPVFEDSCIALVALSRILGAGITGCVIIDPASSSVSLSGTSALSVLMIFGRNVAGKLASEISSTVLPYSK